MSNYGVKDLGNGGARWIPELGLYDDRNRFMSPDLGRFLQPDPIGFKGDSSNLYRYCGNDWANRTDPMGLWSPEAHDEIFDYSLHDYAPQKDVARLQKFSRRFDERTTMNPQKANEHAMRKFLQ